MTLDADPTHNPKAVYDLIEKLDPPPFHVTQAEIKVTFLAPLPGTRSRTRTFRISYPAWCNLRHVGRDEIIRNMLTASGIELVNSTLSYFRLPPEASSQGVLSSSVSFMNDAGNTIWRWLRSW